jgi:hypothetical protein
MTDSLPPFPLGSDFCLLFRGAMRLVLVGFPLINRVDQEKPAIPRSEFRGLFKTYREVGKCLESDRLESALRARDLSAVNCNRPHAKLRLAAVPAALAGNPVMAIGPLKVLRKAAEPPAGDSARISKISNPTNYMRPAGGGAFILPSMVGV